jgi:hypothetical protein
VARRFAHVHARLDLKQQPCTPRTGGKVDRFIQTVIKEWDYARVRTY